MASLLRPLLSYLEAFEVAYDSDEWNVLDGHFTDNAVYKVVGAPPFAGEWPTRDGIKRQFKKICDEFDRRFDQRIVGEAGRPRVSGDQIHFDWRAVYRLKGVPDCHLAGKSVARFADGRIMELTDTMTDEDCLAGLKYLTDFAAELKPTGAYVPIRRALRSVPEVHAMLNALWEEIQAYYSFTAKNPMSFKSFEGQGSALWLAFKGSTPVGSIGIYPESEGAAELDAMYVAPELRRTGLAQRLLSVAGRFAAQNRFRSIRLRAGEPQKAAVRFYEKAGFSRIEAFGKWKSDPTAWCYEMKL
jgi:GNAT superfamily N-acetyltransferase